MKNSSSPVKSIFAVLGCLLVFSLPVLGILAIWGFDTNKIKSEFFALFNPNSSENNYNFEITAGEDDLLTSSILNESNSSEITPRTNPATFFNIESAQIEGNIVYGSDGESLLRQGFWHHPATVYPGETGVSVIFGHRRYHLPPAKDTFYNLDKVQIGDRIEILLQDGTWMEYSVVNVEVINPEELNNELNEQTDKKLVKFITCTPLGTSLQRLVVTSGRII